MAYSFARSESEFKDYVGQGNKNKLIEDNSLGESDADTGPEYLDLGFGWLNEYDKAGNYRPNRNRNVDLNETRQENPYGWKALGPTRRAQLRSTGVNDLRRSRGNDLRQTAKVTEKSNRDEHFDDLRHTSGSDLQQTGGNDFQLNNISRIQQSRESRNLQEAYSIDLRTSKENYLRETNRNPIRQSNRDGIRSTSNNEIGDPVQFQNFSRTSKEHPAGWKAFVPPLITETEDDRKTGNFLRTTTTNEENPYGWKVLGPTRRPPSNNFDTESTFRQSRKRTYQASFSRSSHLNIEDQSNISHNQLRSIKHAKRLSTLPEENVQNMDRTNDEARGLYGATGNGDMRNTIGGQDLRRTSYDYTYARNIHLDPSAEQNYRQPDPTHIRENEHRKWALEHAPCATAEHWTDIATDRSLMRKWYELFARIKRRWAVNYRDVTLLSKVSRENSDLGHAHITTKASNKKRQLSGRRRQAAICALVFLIVLVAVVVPVSILTGHGSEKEVPAPKGILWEYRLQATVTNRNFTEDMSNVSTEAFRNISKPFCDQIDENGSTSSFNYNGCVVTSLEEGSVVVNFSIVLNATEIDRPTKTEVQVALGLNSTESFFLGQFEIAGPVTILLIVAVQPGNNPIPDKKDFNMTCTDGDLCRTDSSLCINSVCSCPYNMYHEESLDTCLPVSCGEIPDIANGLSMANGSYYGSVLIIECDNGYELSENNTLQCTSVTSWITLPTCNIIQCENFTIPDHAIVDVITTQNKTYQDEIIISCDQGFELIGQNKSECMANKTWSPIPTCERVNCSKPDLPNNSLLISENVSFVFESVVELECSMGYILEGTRNISCLANKTWTEFPTCNPVTCPSFRFPENAIEIDNIDGKVFKETIVIECTTGYYLVGNDTVECLAGGVWSESPNCTILDCGDLKAPVNGMIESNGGTKFNMTRTVSCNEGFKLKDKGTDLVLCTQYGNWSSFPECELKMCPYVNVPKNSVLQDNNYTTTVNSVVTIECLTGYILTGNNTVLCLENETWTDFPSCILLDCGKPDEIENGEYIVGNETTTTFNSTISAECFAGYELKGSEIIVCESTGLWTSPPICDPINCSLTDIPNDFDISDLNDRTYLVNSSITLNCIPGFLIQGNGTIVCQANGSWTAIQECIPVICPIFDTPNNSSIVGFNETAKFEYLDIVLIECNIGFNLKGNDTIVCQADGTWTMIPKCIPIVCPQFDTPNNSLTVDFNDSAKFEYLDIVKVECDIGYNLTGKDTFTCQANGTWTAIPECNPIFCPQFDTPNNSLIVGLNQSAKFAYLDIVMIECDIGYILTGNDTIICQANGTWTIIPECIPIVCPLIDTPNNTIIVGFDKSAKFEYLDIVKLECDIGYNLTGNESITCTEYGNWTNIPDCLKIRCNSFEVENGRTGNQSFYSEALDIECDRGYELSNNKSVICSENGQWSRNPTCEAVDCGEFTLPEHAMYTNNRNSSVFNTTLEVTCEANYALADITEAYITCEANGNWKGEPECIKIPALYFTASTTTPQIGDYAQLQCTIVGNLSSSELIISRNSTIRGEERLCSKNQTGPVNCSFYVSPSGDYITETITFSEVACVDGGTYYCESVANSSLREEVDISVTRKGEETPQPKLPIRMVVDLLEQSQTISCTADVGYPLGELRIEYRSDNSTDFSELTLGQLSKETLGDGCFINKTVTYSLFTFTDSWNNTDVRCAIYNHTGDAIPNKVSDVEKIHLIENNCPTNESVFRYHPLNCHHYIYCNSGNIDVLTCGEFCPHIQNSTTSPTCSGNCTLVGC